MTSNSIILALLPLTIICYGPRIEKCHNRKGVVKYITPVSDLDKTSLAPIAGKISENFVAYRACHNQDTTFWTQHYLAKITEPCASLPLKQLKHSALYYEEIVLSQLIPECDLNSKYQKMLTHLAINLVPQVKVFAEGNWKKLELFLRGVIDDKIHRELKIFTGVLGSRFETDEGGNVPLYFYKVVIYSPEKTVAYIGVNDVRNKYKEICNRVILDCGWPDMKNGKVYCCELDDDLNRVLGFTNEEYQF